MHAVHDVYKEYVRFVYPAVFIACREHFLAEFGNGSSFLVYFAVTVFNDETVADGYAVAEIPAHVVNDFGDHALHAEFAAAYVLDGIGQARYLEIGERVSLYVKPVYIHASVAAEAPQRNLRVTLVYVDKSESDSRPIGVLS